jgi:hypothetical protein
MNSAAGVHPARLARELEHRGFESMWVPEHTHIPTSRTTPHPSVNPLPEGYLHMMNPFVSLAAASAVTDRLVLGTAVALILQHDVVDLATETASLDVISGGRLDAMLRGDDGRPDVAGAVEHFRRMVSEYGRDPDEVPISLLLFSRPSPARVRAVCRPRYRPSGRIGPLSRPRRRRFRPPQPR